MVDVLVKWILFFGPTDSSVLPPLEVNTQKTLAQPEISQWMVKTLENLQESDNSREHHTSSITGNSHIPGPLPKIEEKQGLWHSGAAKQP